MSKKVFLVGPAAKGETAPFATGTKEEIEKCLQSLKNRGIVTYLDSFEYACRQHPNDPFVYRIQENGTVTLSYEEIREMAESFAKGMQIHDLCPEVTTIDGHKLRILGVLSHSYWKTAIIMIGCYYGNYAGNFTYADPEDQLQYNVDHGLFSTLFLSSQVIDDYMRPLEAKQIRMVENVITDSDASPEAIKKLQSFGINVFYIDDLIKEGRESSVKPERINEKSIIYIVTTSGSTGSPKGAMLDHETLKCSGLLEFGFLYDNITKDSYMLNNLILGFGSVLALNAMVITHGGHLLFIERKCTNPLEEVQIADPSFVIWSPLLFNKIYKRVCETIEKLPLKEREDVKKIIEIKTRYFHVTKKYSHPVLDKLIYPLRRKIFGDRLRLFMNVGASLTEEVLTFFRIVTCSPVHNLYGTTETGGFPIIASDTDSPELIGLPQPWYECKLVDVPEKDYFVTDIINGKPSPRGELYIRNHVMRGYLNDPKKTSEVIDPEGWHQTGDIVVMRDGFKLEIIDRKNHVVKLSCGEYLSYEKIENLYTNSKYVNQITIYSDCAQNYAIGIVVPEVEPLLEIAQKKGIPGDIRELCNNEEIEKIIIQDFNEIAKSKRAFYFEYLPRLLLVPEPFTQKNLLLTATCKVRRQAISNKYRSRIEKIYSEDKVEFFH